MKKFNNPKDLKGQDKINRISDLMGRMTTLNESTSLSEIDFIKKGPNGIVYGIIRENRNYFIKTTEKTSGTLMSEDFNYSGGIQNKYDERYHSYAEALKHLNMKFDMLNESYGIEDGTNLFESDGEEVFEANASGLVKIKETKVEDPNAEEVEEPDGKELLDEEPEDVEEQKKVIKVDTPAPPAIEEPIEDEVEVDEFSMEDEGEDPFGDEEGGEDMGDEEGMEEDGDETTKKIQKYTGKIGQLLRDKDEPDAELDKYVINSIISAIDWDEVPDEDVEDIISKIEGEDEEDGEGDEFATDDEEVVDLDAEEGDVEDPFADDGGEELAESDIAYEDDNWLVLDKEEEKPKKKKTKKDESRVFSKKQLMESLLKNATKKSLKKVLKESHRVCEECLGEGCESCDKNEHHNMSHKKYGKFDREEYMLEDDFLELDDDFLELDEPERSPQRKRPNFHHIVKPDLNSDKYLKPRGMRRDGDLMSEKLKGKQHKLDRNKNGRIDAEDFKMMRKGKKQYMDEDMDVMDAIATGQDYLSATRDLDRDYDGIPNRLDMDADGDGRLDFEMGSEGEGYIELDFDSIMGSEAPVKEPGIEKPTTLPGKGTDWDKIKRPQVSPKPKADRDRGDRPRRSFRRKGMFR
jgi:hypothetical protein